MKRSRVGNISRKQIDIKWRNPTPLDLDAARALIDRVHYQDGKVAGEFIIGFADIDEIKAIEPKFVPCWTSENLCIVGTAVIKGGMTHGNPKGRRDLAEKRFPKLKIERLSRDEIVRRMGLALISRVAVEPDLQGYGIGRTLVNECRKRAPALVAGSRYVEVMTSQRMQDAQKLLKKEMQSETSCKQLDFDWRPFSRKSRRPDEMVETDASTIGRPSSLNLKVDRLFVPLSDQPFTWFRSGQKKWELRRCGRQYTLKHVRVGRRVELRRGYKGPDVIWGEILEVIEAIGVDDFFNKVHFKEVIPVADSREQAIKIATDILKSDPQTPLLGFAVGHL